MHRTWRIISSVVLGSFIVTATVSAQSSSPSIPTAPPKPTAPAPIPSQSPPPAVVADPPPVITLMEAGTGDKSPLRYALVKGQEQEMTSTTNVALKQSMGGRDMPPQKLQPMSSKMTATIAEVTASGGAKVDISFADAQAGKAVKGAAVVTSRGTTDSFDIEVPADATDAQKQQIESARQNATQYFVPFPEEPIGQGGSWKVVHTLTQQGMTIEQTIIYTVAAREGTTVTLDMTITQTAAEQDIESPQMPGMKIHLKSLGTAGKGQTKIELGSLLGASTNAEIATDMTMVIAQVGEVKQHMDVAMSGVSTVKPAKE